MLAIAFCMFLKIGCTFVTVILISKRILSLDLCFVLREKAPEKLTSEVEGGEEKTNTHLWENSIHLISMKTQFSLYNEKKFVLTVQCQNFSFVRCIFIKKEKKLEDRPHALHNSRITH